MKLILRIVCVQWRRKAVTGLLEYLLLMIEVNTQQAVPLPTTLTSTYTHRKDSGGTGRRRRSRRMETNYLQNYCRTKRLEDWLESSAELYCTASAEAFLAFSTGPAD